MSIVAGTREEPGRALRNLRDLLRNANQAEAESLASALGGCQHMVAALCDPLQFTLPEAIEMARCLARHNTNLDVQVLHLLRPNADGIITANRRNGRVLALVEEITARTRAIPLLMRALRQADDRVVSRLVLLIGRLRRDPGWLGHYCQSPDARIRANAVEGLWGNSDRASTSLMTSATRDSHHRVVANALVGLHLAGFRGAVDQLERITADSRPLWRAAAAWALGRTGESSAAAALRKLMADPDPRVRGAAVRALVQLRKASLPVPALGAG
jgi:hypothetical protein